VIASKLFGLYDHDEPLLHRTTLDEIPDLFKLATLYALLTSVGQSVLFEGGLEPPAVLALWAMLLVSFAGARAVARRAVQALRGTERCLVIGDEDSADRLERKFAANHRLKAKVVARLPLHGNEHPGVSLIRRFQALTEVLSHHAIDRVILAPTADSSEDLLDMIRQVKSLGIKVSVLPRLFEVVRSSVEVDDIDGTTLLSLRRYGLTRSSLILKRTTDIVVSAVGLVLAAPLLAVIALVVRLDSPGPALFRQHRTGRSDREFELIKFRTMGLDAEALKSGLRDRNEADGIFKIAGDPRVTRVGRFLRRTSLDELPQLINVLHGEMSLVGPRPLVPDEDRLIEGWYRRRLVFAPGMTGPWQIAGSSRIPLSEMVKIDYLYGSNWSSWGDMKILMRTVGYVMRRRGM